MQKDVSRGLIRDVGDDDFDQAVVARSHQVPQVVDFWAEWCGPCRMLGPALEREITALGGAVELAKVDVDANPALSQRFAVRSIPAVKAFVQGQEVAAFEGARDPSFLRRWLEGLVPSRELAEAEAALARGDAAAARAALAKVDPRSSHADAVPGLERRATFLEDAAAGGGEAAARERLASAPGDLDARWTVGSALAARGEREAAVEAFLELLQRSRKYRDDGARLAILALLATYGADDDYPREVRRRLQVIL